jgi:hypothetical protein
MFANTDHVPRRKPESTVPVLGTLKNGSRLSPGSGIKETKGGAISAPPLFMDPDDNEVN